jgi:hypothetical protein
MARQTPRQVSQADSQAGSQADQADSQADQAGSQADFQADQADQACPSMISIRQTSGRSQPPSDLCSRVEWSGI